MWRAILIGVAAALLVLAAVPEAAAASPAPGHPTYRLRLTLDDPPLSLDADQVRRRCAGARAMRGLGVWLLVGGGASAVVAIWSGTRPLDERPLVSVTFAIAAVVGLATGPIFVAIGERGVRRLGCAGRLACADIVRLELGPGRIGVAFTDRAW